MTSNKIIVSEGAATYQFHFFIRHPAASISIAPTHLYKSWNKLLAIAFYWYYDVLNYVLATYATKSVILEAVGCTTASTQLCTEMFDSCGQTFFDKSLHCSFLYEEATLKRTIIERLSTTMSSYMCYHLASSKSSSMNKSV